MVRQSCLLMPAGLWVVLVCWDPQPTWLAAQTPSAANQPAGANPALKARIREQTALANRRQSERMPALDIELRNVEESLGTVEKGLSDRITVDLITRREELNRRKEALLAEKRELQEVATAWRNSSEAYQEMLRLGQDLERIKADLGRQTMRFTPGDALVYRAQLQQTNQVASSNAKYEAAYREELAQIEARLKEPKVDRRSMLESQRNILLASLEGLKIRQLANDVRREVQTTMLEAAQKAEQEAERTTPGGPSTAEPPTSQPSQTQTAPTSAASAKEAENKQKLAQELDLEARDRLAFVRQQIADLQRQREEALRKGENVDSIDNSLQYWRETQQYEVRRVWQATVKKREAAQKQELLDLDQKLKQARSQLADISREYVRIALEQRGQLAEEFRANARGAQDDAAALERQAAITLLRIGTTEESLPVIDAAAGALQQRLNKASSLAEYQRLYDHYLRMKRIFDTERQQIDQMVTSQTVGYYQLLRQAALKRQLAAVFAQTADVLVPPEPSFWEKHKRIIHAVEIFLGMIAAGYVLKLFVWLTERIATWLRKALPAYNFSVKRVTTLTSFAGSIIQLFIWIFGVITILYEFGIDPATSSGAIGLVGLIMAGMFQQIVVDFIKGLDIIAGRHYNVGDFVEVDGKFGHVIDFNAKYTRIRTLSGQEVNIPNSKCIPSRRFPEGYVDNYVDFVLKSGADVNEAKTAIQPVCMYLNRRLEPLKDRPQFIDRFRSVGGRAILRYRVRVLPGCEWVITNYFIPAVKAALDARHISMEDNPQFFFINRIDTFRKLFSRQLTEQEILQEAAELEVPTPDRPKEKTDSDERTHSDKPSVPADGEDKQEKLAAPPVAH